MSNELILKLQQKSRENKETNAKELYEKTVRQLGYSDFFSAVDMNLVLSAGSPACGLTETRSDHRAVR